MMSEKLGEVVMQDFCQVLVSFTALNCPRSTVTSIQLMTPPVLCEAPGGLQEPGAVSRSLPQRRATSLGMTPALPLLGLPLLLHALTLLPSPPLLSSCHLSSRLLYLPLIIYPCSPSASAHSPFPIAALLSAAFRLKNGSGTTASSQIATSLPPPTHTNTHADTHTHQTQVSVPIKQTRPRPLAHSQNTNTYCMYD